VTSLGQIQSSLRDSPKLWLITGVGGFIGSNLLAALLQLEQKVVGLDNFSTGHRHNLDRVRSKVGGRQWARFRLAEGDIRNVDECHDACKGVDYVLHHAALGSVPRSIEDPISTNSSNVGGFLNVLVAARDAEVKRFVYASSSSAYGDHAGSPKVEDEIGRPLSPYAVSKVVNEQYADVFARAYGLEVVGLRYFNVFGPHQDPRGPYAAVIPQWIAAMIGNDPVWVNGDGQTSRDFCYIANIIQANLLAAAVESSEAMNQVYNIAVGQSTSLNELFESIRSLLEARFPHLKGLKARHRDFRAGDVRHSLADISKARTLLGYCPSHSLSEGLAETVSWFAANLPKLSAP
jgi:UDP-N-acetylglucosamine 4-epimerase